MSLSRLEAQTLLRLKSPSPTIATTCCFLAKRTLRAHDEHVAPPRVSFVEAHALLVLAFPEEARLATDFQEMSSAALGQWSLSHARKADVRNRLRELDAAFKSLGKKECEPGDLALCRDAVIRIAEARVCDLCAIMEQEDA